ncbi:MAG: MFS transporter [Gammaproteobacteria bacterium]|nr:MFS transporter [Gammaproteobacteria bacterium]
MKSISGRLMVGSWACYDFANSPFTTLVLTFVYATYFTQAIAADPITGTVLWSRAIALSALIAGVCSPILGFFADRLGYRKNWLIFFTVMCAAATVGLYGVLPGQVATALILIVIANTAYELAMVFYNAFLPDITPVERIGRISGYGWGLGYLGGLLVLIFVLIAFVQPDVPWFGVTKIDGQNIRATNVVVAAWLVVFSVPFVLWVPEVKPSISHRKIHFLSSLSQLQITFRRILKFKEVCRFLMARFIFNNGLVTIFLFGGIYAAESFGFTLQEVLIFGIALNVTAGFGAFLMGYLDDLFGGKKTIIISLVGLILAVALAVLTSSKLMLWVSGMVIGVFSGPNQSASRSLMARLVPSDSQAQFFGFYAFSGKFTAFLGPLLFGIVTQWTGSQRWGLSVVLVMLFLGMLIMLPLDEHKGMARVGRVLS